MNAKNSKGKKTQNTKSEEQETQWTDITDNKKMEEEEDKEESEEEYEVEVIVDKMIKKGQVFYKVKWKNYSLDDCTWEPEANLDNCPLKIREYENQLLAKSKEKAAETPKEVSKEAPIKPEIKTEEVKAEEPASQEKKSTKKGTSNKPAAGIPSVEPESITGKRDRQQFEEEKPKAEEKAAKTKKEKSGKKKNEETADKDKTSQGKINNKPEAHPEADEESISKIRKLSPKSSGQPESQVTQTKDGSGNIKSINSGTDTYPPPVKYVPKDLSHQTTVEKQQIEKIYDEVFAKAKQSQPAGGKNASSDQNPPTQAQSSNVMLEEKDSKANSSIKGSQQELNKGISLSKIMQDEKLMEMSETESRSEAQENEKKNQGSEASPFDDKGSKSKKKARSEYGALDKGDIPLKVVGIRPVKENKDLEIMISWKTREDGVKPYNSKVMRIDLLKSGFYMPLIEFYESKMKLEGAPAFDPGMLPKI